MRKLIACLVVMWMTGSCVFSMAREVDSETSVSPAELQAATRAALDIPAGVKELLADYAEAFESESEEDFVDCFWNPKPYLKNFREIVKGWYDIRIRYLQVKAFPSLDQNRLLLKVTWQFRARENRTRKLFRLELEGVELVLERRQDSWRILSSRTPPQEESSQ
jgi:hypothetical protein